MQLTPKHLNAAPWADIDYEVSHAANSARRILTGRILLTLSSFLFIAIPSLHAVYPLMALTALGTGFVFTPFQVFMKAVDRGNGDLLPRSVGLYTFSWSSGAAAGPFVSAFVWNRYGWQACHGIGIALSIITGAGILLLKHHAAAHPVAGGDASPDTNSPCALDYSGMPDLAWLGWLCSGVGCLVLGVLTSYLPSSATAMGIPRSHQGILLALVSAFRALTRLAMCRSRMWMYKAWPVLLSGVCGICGIVVFAFTGRLLPLAVAAALFGAYSGVFFYLVFHSLVHPEHSTRYVAAHESVVELMTLLGPLLAGLLASGLAVSAPYLVSALLILVAVAFQGWVTWCLQEKV